IPASLQADFSAIPDGMLEPAVSRLLQDRMPQLMTGGCFLGAGAYEHYIPAVVWAIVGRGEFYTAYTPYQAEASKGSLRVMYEYQTMIDNLMGMEVANASLYDGASALAEAVLMAVRLKKSQAKRVWAPLNLHPHYRQVLQTLLAYQNIQLEFIP